MPDQSATSNDLTEQIPPAFQLFPLAHQDTGPSSAGHEEAPCRPTSQLDFPEIFPVYPFI
ncbi:hypothetical protein ACFRAU_08030 [Arthrobacter sp. NPDC056691]|uniref:hypothetical protein n=1 Tax=unclassified Arthrobacter TaxID=235627 RepID=UPI00366B33CB